MTRRRSGHPLDADDLARREPVWKALSTLWLGAEPRPRELAWIAGVLHDSAFELDELRAIYLYEVAPAVHGHLPDIAHQRSAFDEPWLYGRARRRAERRSVWLRLRLASPIGRRRMTSVSEPYWNIVVDLLTRMRARSSAASISAID